MFFRFKKKSFITFSLIILGISVVAYQNKYVYAKNIKQDGLLLIDTLNEENIKIEKIILNYSGLLGSYENISKVHSFKEELEKAFSINLTLTSEPDEKELIKYQGQKNISSLPNTRIQVGLAGVLHENDTYQAHLIISLLNNSANAEDFVESFAYLKKSLDSISVEPKIKINIQGSFNHKLSHDTQQNMIMNMFADLDASVHEGLNEKEVISLTGYSEKLSYSLKSNETPINIQIASRYNPLNGKTNFTIGTPLITMTY